MSEIGTYTNNFFNDVVNYGYEMPINFRIYVLIIFLIILAELYFVFVKNIPLDKKYIKWGFIFIILNVINIIIIFYMYSRYKGKFIGEPGEPGLRGNKGSIGENITCKLCDYNIYLQKTNRYDLKMLFSTNIFNLIYNQDFNYISIYNTFNTSELDIDKLLTNLYNNELTNELESIPNLINNQKYILMYDLLRELLPKYEKLTIKTPGRKRGYLPVSDIIVSEKYEGNSYVFNSDDMRYPTSYNKITSIYSIENGNKLKYDVMKLNGSTEGENKYSGLGIVLFNSDQKKELNQYVCLNEKCLKKAEVQDYKIKYIYPDDNIGFISFWLSDFNTMQVVHAKEEDIIDGKRIIEIIKSFNEDIYYSSGEVRRDIVNQTASFLNNIKISKLSAFCFIISSYISIINNDFKIFKNKYIESLDINLGIYSSKNIRYTNVINILKKLDDELFRIEKKYNNKLAELSDVPVESIISGSVNTGQLIYNAKKMVISMRNTLNFIPNYIENTETLMDLVEKIFLDGLYTRVKKNNLNNSQKSLIYLIKVIMPPLIDIYIPKNSCLVYEQIDEERINLLNTCEQVINDYNTLIENLNTDTTNKYSDDLRNEINRLNDIVSYEFDNNLSNIIDYMNKMSVNNFKEFTNTQLKLIIEQYNKILMIEEK
jgi:hypothetical protein